MRFFRKQRSVWGPLRNATSPVVLAVLSVTLTSFVAPAATAAAAATLSPEITAVVAVGPERRAPLASRPAAPWTCTLADGGTVQLELRYQGDVPAGDQSTTSTTSVYDDDKVPGAVVVYIRNAAGELRTEPFVANVLATHAFNEYAVSASCLGNGSIVTTWQRFQSLGGELIARIFDADGAALSDEIVLPDSQTWWHSANAIAAAPMNTSRLALAYDAVAGLTVIRLDATTGAMSAPVVLADRHGEGLAVRAGGGLVGLAWLEGERSRHSVFATMVGPDTGYAADPTSVNTHPYGNPADVNVFVLAPGRFAITWANEAQGGRVARTVALETAATATTSTTTTTIDRAGIRFPNVVTLDAASDTRWVHYGGRQLLGADEQGTWLATWRAGNRETPDSFEYVDTYGYSGDDGRHWTIGPPIRATDDLWGSFDAHVSGDGTGTWLQTWYAWTASDSDYAVLGARSDDRGATWTEPRVLYEPASRGDLYWGGPAFLEVRAVSPPNWVMALGDTLHYGVPQLETATVRLLRSGDGGETWHLAAEFPRDTDISWNSGALAVSAHASFLVWSENDVLMITTSKDGGDTWTSPSRLHDDEVVSYGTLGYVEGVNAAIDADGVAVITWRGTGLYGEDSDVLYVRSADGGDTWSEPKPIADYATADDAEDGDPSVAVDAAGLWLVTWASHYDGDGRWGMDGDVLFSSSVDGGLSWSPPRPVVDDARSDDTDDRTAKIATSFPGVFGILWSREITDVSPAEVTIRFASSSIHCGDGNLDPGETCDDGNSVEGDGCDTNCRPSGCGNGIVDPSEECDDANDDETDDCLSSCRYASCGDGWVHRDVEQCDDGNGIDGDACTNACRVAACGDGIVYAGHEACDDGNTDRFDACLPTCQAARCGDWLVWIGVEECDDGNRDDDDSCRNDCTFGPGCASPLATQPVATDARRVLRYAVGTTPSCEFVTCDLDHDGVSTAVDAAMVLQAAVGLLPWQCRGDEIVARLLTPVVLGALQFQIPHAGAFQRIARRPDGTVDCDVAAGRDVYAAINDGDDALLVGMVGLAGFAGPADLVICRIEGGTVGPGELDVVVEDASTPDLTPLAAPDIIAFGR